MKRWFKAVLIMMLVGTMSAAALTQRATPDATPDATPQVTELPMAEARLDGEETRFDLALTPDAVDASATLAPDAPANFGAAALPAGFQPDPYIVTVISGGTVDVAALDLGADCIGYASAQPDFILDWTGTADVLRIFFLANQDTTLIVQTPDERTLCSDDFRGFQPAVEIAAPIEGSYRIWVGSFNADTFIPGYLMATAGGSLPGLLTAPLLGGENSAALLPSADRATFGELEIAPGFMPDPIIVSDIVTGGDFDVSEQALGTDCVGYASATPDYRIDLKGSAETLRFLFVSPADSVLIVHMPGDVYRCGDDWEGGDDPLVDIENAPPGVYNVWVASSSAADRVSGTLFITEILSNTPATVAEFLE